MCHLLQLGHRRIGIVTEPLNLLNAADRLAGYKRALRSNGIPLDRALIRRGDDTEGSGYRQGLELLKLADRPTAVLVCNNLMTMGFLGALRELRVACPREVSLVGFDDFEWSLYLAPPLTTVRQPASEMGAEAAKAVLSRVRHAGPNETQKVQLLTQLVVRESTAAPAKQVSP
jgi:LacI family xylobiose transport system transcriptional regulator